MGNDNGKDNENGKKIQGLKIPEIEMTAYFCDCCYLYCRSIVWLNAVLTLSWLATIAPSHHNAVETNAFGLSLYLFWLWRDFLKQP